MSSLRKDYLLDRWTLISTNREKRPNLIAKKRKVCYFCVGNEKLTPKETGRVQHGDVWELRSFYNKFPAVNNKKSNVKSKKYLVEKNTYGIHEIIVDSNDEKKQLWDFDESHLLMLLKFFIKRLNIVEKDNKIKHIALFKNHGKDAGASIQHSHCQLVGLDFIPKHILEESKARKKCVHCDILEIESKSIRRCYETKNIVAFTPFASRYHYELKILPKRHVKDLRQLNENELFELSEIILKALRKLRSINSSYDMYFHNSIKDGNSHFHVKIAPRLAVFAGFELETGVIINTVSPEQAAKFYRK